MGREAAGRPRSARGPGRRRARVTALPPSPRRVRRRLGRLKWQSGEERGRKGLFPRERASGRSSGRRVRCLRKTCHTRTRGTEREPPAMLDSLVAAILLLADGETGERSRGRRREKWPFHRSVRSESASPLPTQIFVRPPVEFASIRGDHEEDEAASAAEDIRGRERRMNICKLQRATPSGGSRIGDQSQERRGERGKKRFGDHHDARHRSWHRHSGKHGRYASKPTTPTDAGEERGRGRRCENSNLGGMYVAS